MASEPVHTTVNGHHEPSQSYSSMEGLNAGHNHGQATNGATSAQPNAVALGSDTSGVAETNGTPSKDEVGWYFVEQYYTTLSKSPEKLHLFYNKRSQFVSGVEAERVSVSVGQRAISERIKELDIQDCKVRVSNVDSQESFKNIVVQVIGEMSNKAAPHRKFVQTFVLAEQPNGYFVLNDIFRYINEEEEEVEEQAASKTEDAVEEVPEDLPKTLTSSHDLAAQEQHAELVDKKLEETITDGGKDELVVPETTTNGNNSSEGVEDQEGEEEEKPSSDNDTNAALINDDPEEATEQQGEVEELPVEKPRDPEPTPVASPPTTDTVATTPNISVPTPAPTPAAPLSWANLVASRAPRAAVPAVSATSTSPAPPQTKTVQPPTNPSVSTQQPIANEDASSPAQQSPGAGWQTAGQDNGKRQARQQSISVSGNAGEKTNILGYVKNVTEKVDAAELKATLNKYGKLEYFDVSRQKNCAFVEFADIAGYNAAVAANPHLIGGEQIYVEERRPRPTAYGGNFNNRGNMRGARGGPEGRAPTQGRGGFQKEGNRGGFVPRGRGGNLASRGRGMPQAA